MRPQTTGRNKSVCILRNIFYDSDWNACAVRAKYCGGPGSEGILAWNGFHIHAQSADFINNHYARRTLPALACAPLLLNQTDSTADLRALLSAFAIADSPSHYLIALERVICLQFIMHTNVSIGVCISAVAAVAVVVARCSCR